MIPLLFFAASTAAQITVAAKVLAFRWFRALPWFAAFACAISLQQIATWLALIGDSDKYGEGIQFWSTAPVAFLQLAATLEAYGWFSSLLPRFRLPGFCLLALLATASGGMTWWFSPTHDFATYYGLVGAISWGAGVGSALFLVAAMGVFEKLALPGQAGLPSAWWHGLSLALLGICDGFGWALAEQGRMWLAGPLIALGPVLFALCWLAGVTDAPSWNPPAATGNARAEVEGLR